MSNKVFGIVIALLIGSVVALIAFSGTSEAPSVSRSQEEVLQVTETDYIKNESLTPETLEDKVTIIEYGDFQCPACAASYPIIQQALSNYTDEVAFVFRHFPLVSIHPNAMIAHRAAEAAGEQGQFYPMHDLLYEFQQIWSQADNAQVLIDGYAEDIGLDMDQYRATFNSSETLKAINAQLDEGESIGVSSTPTFFVNGEQLQQVPRTAEEWVVVIENALSELGSEQQ